jgi:hypothetical protein
MVLLAVRAIDVAIFGTLGGLWIGGAVFIVLLYRWIARFERSGQPSDGAGAVRIKPVVATPTPAAPPLGIPATVTQS